MNNISDSSFAFQQSFLGFPQIYEERKNLILPYIIRLAFRHEWKHFCSETKSPAEKKLGR